ncbi:hypothetical protein SCP_1100520 [Sparassis crispa]|uniref:Uncharacterized protein n=1 Tax=Sparassis crispa TaxID=139825 RepID=A0A401GYY3_9APHY|nr:hypothetical protein SCP_1100520 [Sparassis crispa]GBE87377.1 hypothetical protein SCP_1100520 [Sparassis crispa]
MSQPTLPMETDDDEATTSRPATQQQGRPRSTSPQLQFRTAVMPQALQQPPLPPIAIRSMAAPAIATTSTTTAPTGAGNTAVMEWWVSFGTHQFTLYHTEACAVCYSYLQHIAMARNTAPCQEAHTDALNAEQHLFWEHFQTYTASEGGGRDDVPMQQRNMELQAQLGVAETEATTQRRQVDDLLRKHERLLRLIASSSRPRLPLDYRGQPSGAPRRQPSPLEYLPPLREQRYSPPSTNSSSRRYSPPSNASGSRRRSSVRYSTGGAQRYVPYAAASRPSSATHHTPGMPPPPRHMPPGPPPRSGAPGPLTGPTSGLPAGYVLRPPVGPAPAPVKSRVQRAYEHIDNDESESEPSTDSDNEPNDVEVQRLNKQRQRNHGPMNLPRQGASRSDGKGKTVPRPSDTDNDVSPAPHNWLDSFPLLVNTQPWKATKWYNFVPRYVRDLQRIIDVAHSGDDGARTWATDLIRQMQQDGRLTASHGMMNLLMSW